MKLSNKQKEEMELVLELTKAEYKEIYSAIHNAHTAWTDIDILTWVEFQSDRGTSVYARVKVVEVSG